MLEETSKVRTLLLNQLHMFLPEGRTEYPDIRMIRYQGYGILSKLFEQGSDYSRTSKDGSLVDKRVQRVLTKVGLR